MEGKFSLANDSSTVAFPISNAKLRVGNFSGVTVAKEEVFLEYKKYKIQIYEINKG